MTGAFDIAPARSREDIDTAREMFSEYQRWLNVDLCFQDFETELAGLPGKYRPPAGEIYIARDEGAVAGIIAIRPVGKPDEKMCEMKRLYVRPAWRGRGLGKQLAMLALEFAGEAGYRRMVLDTLPHLEAAKSMYARMGFGEMAPYYHNPLPGVVYMEKLL